MVESLAVRAGEPELVLSSVLRPLLPFLIGCDKLALVTPRLAACRNYSDFSASPLGGIGPPAPCNR